MTQLNQVVAAEKGVKTRSDRATTDFYHLLQKPDLFNGFSRTYKANNEDDTEVLPSERKLVQNRVPDVLDLMAKEWAKLFDITATKDYGNTMAGADVKVDGRVLLHDVPVTYLLWLEKQLTHVITVFGAIPTLDPSESWDQDPHTGTWKTGGSMTVRTRKIDEPVVLHPGTDRHAPQVQLVSKDVQVGTWTRILESGALPATKVRELVDRATDLLNAVKFAREQANSHTIDEQKTGVTVFSYLLGDLA